VIVKSVVEHHGGSIWFTSRPGAGSTFTVSLPTMAAATRAGPALVPAREGAAR
jgi:signal transduction histidine kinase